MQATGVASDGAWIDGSSAGLHALPSGVYTVEIWNATWDGVGEPAGATLMRVYRGSELPPDADGDGYRADMDCNDSDATIYPGASAYCTMGADRNCNFIDDYDECYGSGGPGGGGGDCSGGDGVPMPCNDY